MAQSNKLARSMHDGGLAAWFGGSLFGVAALNAATRELRDPRERTRIANEAWGRWTPYNLAAIVVHLIGGLQIVRGNKSRIAAQKGVAGASSAKLALTLAALGATAYTRKLGQDLMDAEASSNVEPAGELSSEGATEPGPTAPDEAKHAQRQLRWAQCTVPALTGALVVLQAVQGEQQRPSQVARGFLARLSPGA